MPSRCRDGCYCSGTRIKRCRSRVIGYSRTCRRMAVQPRHPRSSKNFPPSVFGRLDAFTIGSEYGTSCCGISHACVPRAPFREARTVQYSDRRLSCGGSAHLLVAACSDPRSWRQFSPAHLRFELPWCTRTTTTAGDSSNAFLRERRSSVCSVYTFALSTYDRTHVMGRHTP